MSPVPAGFVPDGFEPDTASVAPRSDYQPNTAYGQPIVPLSRIRSSVMNGVGPIAGMNQATPTGAMFGGGIGLALGGPLGALVGAGLGAAAGHNLTDIADRLTGGQPPAAFTPPALARLLGAAKTGVSQEAIGQAGGKVIDAGLARLQPIAGRMAQTFQAGALNPGKNLLAEDRNLVANTLRSQQPITEGMTMEGANAMTAALKASHAAEDEIAAAAKSSYRRTPSQILNEMEARIRAAAPRNKRLTVVDSPEWQKMREQFLKDYSEPVPGYAANSGATHGDERPFDVFSALQAKRAADKASFAARQAQKASQLRPTNQGQDVEELFNRELGDVLRIDLRREIPGLGRQMQKTRELMPMERAYLQAEARNQGLGEGGVAKNLVRAALSPASMSRRAMSLHRMSQATPDATALARLVPYLFNPQTR